MVGFWVWTVAIVKLGVRISIEGLLNDTLPQDDLFSILHPSVDHLPSKLDCTYNFPRSLSADLFLHVNRCGNTTNVKASAIRSIR